MTNPAESNGTPGAALLPSKILVVDDDSSFLAATAKALKSHAIVAETDDSAESAWQKFQTGQFDFILLDWKMSPLSGANFLHRVRAHKDLQDVPIVVLSGYIKKQDFRFAEEYLFTSILEKPLDMFLMMRRIKDLVKEKLWYDNEKTRINTLVERVQEKPEGDALQSLMETLSKSPRPIPVTLLAARNLLNKGVLEPAGIILKELLKKSPNCTLALTMLGKVLVSQKNYEEALPLLKKACEASPDNPDRLCLLGDANMQMLRTEEAEGYFNQAAKLDPTSEKAQAGKSLAKNVTEYLNNEDLGKMPDSYAGLLNSVGVALVRSGRFEEGMEHYKNALNFVEQNVLQARLTFNLGLGYMRWKKPEEATVWLEKSATLGGTEFNKAGEYLVKLKSKGGAKAPADVKDGKTVAEAVADEFQAEEILSEDTSGEKTKEAAKKPAAATPPAAPTAKGKEASAAAAGPAGAPASAAAPTAEKPAAEAAVGSTGDPFLDKIVAMMATLGEPDSTLYKKTGNLALKRTHNAYFGLMENRKLVVFIPNTTRPKAVIKPDRAKTLRTEVFIHEDLGGGHWQRVWPQETKKKAS